MSKSPTKKPAKARRKPIKKAGKAVAKTAKKQAKQVARVDREATHRVARWRDTAPMRVFAAFCEAADQPPLIAASAGTLAVGLLRRRGDLARGGARMLASHLVATGAKLAVKHQFDRTRPSRAMQEGHRFEPSDEGGHDEKSFPSGHTAGAVAVARAAAHEIDGAAVPATLVAGAAAAGQAPTGNHYLTDIAAGAAIGWAAEKVVGTAFEWLEARYPPQNGEGNRSA